MVIAESSGMFNMPIFEFKAFNINNETNNLFRLWHEGLGHISKGKFLEIKKNNLFCDNNILANVNPTNEMCEACLNGKQARLRFEKRKNKEHITRPLFVIHSDVCGPITPVSIDDKNYCHFRRSVHTLLCDLSNKT